MNINKTTSFYLCRLYSSGIKNEKGFKMKKFLVLSVLSMFIAGFEVPMAFADTANAPTQTKVQKEGLKQGLKNGTKAGLKDGAKAGTKEGLKYGAKNGQKDGLKYGLKDGLKEGLKNGTKDGLKNGQVNGVKKSK